MQPEIIVLIILAAVVLIAVAIVLAVKRRSERLRERFGPEYDRTVEQAGGRRSAESELAARQRRVDSLDIRPLDLEARDEFARQWRDAQARFVDEPAQAVAIADRLVAEVMRERGYPVEDFEQREADISVDHPRVVQNYRAGHALSMAAQQGRAGTEDLRQAMVHYRSLFEELLESGIEEPEIVVDVGEDSDDRQRSERPREA
jgi:hypothetical protein